MDTPIITAPARERVLAALAATYGADEAHCLLVELLAERDAQIRQALERIGRDTARVAAGLREVEAAT